MSRLFGPMRQLGFVVRDLDRALQYWTQTLGVGPFFVIRRLPLERFEYRGNPSPPPAVTIAIASSGELQVELIAQADDHPSAFRDRLNAGSDGLQHVSAWVNKAGYDADVARLKAAGVPIAHEGWLPGGGPRFAFFATDHAPGGFQFEVSDVGDPAFSAMGETIRQAAIGWDGSNPVRDLAI
jgi:catechol 2,3-dioxygenase-like lactoylglutathione lyase family enzyme